MFDAGKIVENGTYEQLMENGGFFAEPVERQKKLVIDMEKLGTR